MDRHHVEMSEHVHKQSRGHSSSFKDKNSRPPSGGSVLLNNRNVDGDLFSKDGNTSSGDNQSSAGDREMLLKTHSKRSDSFSDEIVMMSDRDSCVTTLPFHDTSFDSYRKHDVTGSRNTVQLSTECVHIANGTPLTTSVQIIKHSGEGLHLSANSLLFSDSDSGTDDIVDIGTKRKKRHSQLSYPVAMSSSASHNGVLCNGEHSFNDFKAPPPPYGALKNKTSALDTCRISSDCIVTH